MKFKSQIRSIGQALAVVAFFGWVSGAQADPLPMPKFEGSVSSIDLVSDARSVHLVVGLKEQTETTGEQPATAPAKGKGSRGGARSELLYTRLDPPFKAWSEPTKVNVPGQMVSKVSRGSDAKLAVNGPTMIVVWTLPGNGAMGTGALTMSRSENGGKSWQAGPVYGPVTDAAETEATKHGFRFPAVAVRNGEFHLVWIDAWDEARRLGYTKSSDGGKSWTKPALVDREICACCPNSLAATGTGVVALYRNQQPSDMGLASIRSETDATITPSVEGFNWIFEGCPHVGGGMVVLPASGTQPETIVCSTWSGSAEHGGVHVTRSTDGGTTWSKPTRVSETNGSRTNDLAALDVSKLAVVWDELVALRKVVFAATSADGGVTWSKPVRLSAEEGDGNCDHPRVAAVDGRFIVAWTQAESATSTQLRLEVRELPAGK